jgi:DNA-binding NarL/FixJ family response regulator
MSDTEDRIRVLLVDDQSLIRMGFRLVLRGEPGIEVVGEAGDGLAALAELARLDGACDVVLMDVRMPRLNGIDATARIVSEFPNARVLVLTTFDLDEYAQAAIRAGASGFLLKDARPTELVDAIQRVASGDAVMAPQLTRRMLERMVEREVLMLIGEGCNNTEIGKRLFLSESTVKTHVGRILFKLDLRDRIHAVILAKELGF